MSTPPRSIFSAPRTPWWLWPNLLSLDAPLVAVLWQRIFAMCLGERVPPGCDLALGLGVWLIYIVDRISDSFSSVPDSVLSPRHLFYRTHRTMFIRFVIPGLVATLLWLVCAIIPAEVIWRGLDLGFVVAIYLLQNSIHARLNWKYLALNVLLWIAVLLGLKLHPISHSMQLLFKLMLAMSVMQVALGLRFRLPKEILCGYLFALGCGLSLSSHTPGGLTEGRLLVETLLAGSLFALNCIAISCYEKRTDEAFDAGALFQRWPAIERIYPLLLILLCFAALAQMFWDASASVMTFGMTILSCASLLAMVHYCAPRISSNLARVLVDAALVIPGIIVFL